MSSIHAVILAAGTGSRFGSTLPKQFHRLGPQELPVVIHSLAVFVNAGVPIENIRLTVSAEMEDFVKELFKSVDWEVPQIVRGGATRFESVKNALDTINCSHEDIILIHDGARPLVTEALIKRVVKALDGSTAAIPSVKVTDSLREISSDGRSHPVERARFYAVQTPQGFHADTIKTAYKQPFSPMFTDDASVVEENGVRVTMVEGEYTNLKITSPTDLAVAEALLASLTDRP